MQEHRAPPVPPAHPLPNYATAVAPPRATPQELRRLTWWLINGRPTSPARYLAALLSGTEIARGGRLSRCLPCDLPDFRGCDELLSVMPHWRERLNLIVPWAPEWGPLVDEWHQITEFMHLGRAGLAEALLRSCVEQGVLQRRWADAAIKAEAAGGRS